MFASLIFEQFLQSWNWQLGSALASMLLLVTGASYLPTGAWWAAA